MNSILKNPFTWIIALGIMLVFSIWKNFNQGEKINGLQAGQKLINERFEDQKKYILKLEDSIKESEKWLLMDLASLKNDFLKFEKDLESINKTSDDKKTAIRAIRDVDSLTKLLTNRYN